jgi:signal transduction histidine kinase
VSRFFEPFWRKSESRTDQMHLGLGLAVAHTLVASMGAEISATLVEQIVHVQILMPSAAAGADRVLVEERPGPPEICIPRRASITTD